MYSENFLSESRADNKIAEFYISRMNEGCHSRSHQTRSQVSLP